MELPFKPVLKPRNPSRFSDGTWPVLYASLDKDTPTFECNHHYPKFWNHHTVYFSLLECDFSGPTKDLRPKQKLKRWAKLTDANTYNKFCRDIGKEAASSLNVGALLAPSVRLPGGTNAVVFKKDCLLNPAIVGELKLDLGNPAVRVKK